MQNILSFKPSLVIFDMDGLIFDTERLFMHYLTINNKNRNYELTFDMYVDTLGLAGENLRNKLFKYFGNDYPMDEISHKTREDMRLHIKEKGIPVKEGIPELLSYLTSHNIPCCVASSSQKRFVQDYLCVAGLNKYFDFIIGGDMVQNSKPAPDIFLAAATTFGIPPEHCVVLEDSENGLRAAHAAKMSSICIPDLKYPNPDVAKITSLIVDSASALIPKQQTP